MYWKFQGYIKQHLKKFQKFCHEKILKYIRDMSYFLELCKKISPTAAAISDIIVPEIKKKDKISVKLDKFSSTMN